MTVRGAILGTLLATTIACEGATDPTSMLASKLPGAPSLALNPSYGLRDFELTAFSYGPNFEEYDSGSCVGLYNTVQDSVQVWPGPTPPPAYIKVLYYKRVGCQIGSPSGGPYVGGNITFQITNSGGVSRFGTCRWS
jgi:hypothetical protein